MAASVTEASAPLSSLTRMLVARSKREVAPAGSGIYSVTIPAAQVTEGILTLSVVCPSGVYADTVGQIDLYDPSGIVTDAATGLPVGPGIVAVDPTVIPLGTRMTIPGYGEGVAADTGPGIRGVRVDLWFPTRAEALAWGWQTVTVTLH